MKPEFHEYKFHESTLMAVPAVHHQSAFASQVHNICRSNNHRPDAIAVELSHSVVLKIVDFLKELKQGGEQKINLPCIMGLLIRNNIIHPDYVERASLLQEFYCKPLYNIPDNILAERLNFSKYSNLILSPADSIIEAIRCAIELNIPIYGVDLEEFSRVNNEKFSLEDPFSAHKNYVEYSTRVLKYCDANRDPKIDFNRETFMVAGLKNCLNKHSRVLFTCGMAHWNQILTLLDNKDILPFPVHEFTRKPEIRKVIIHPTLAVSVMEVVPQITMEYEKNRYPVTSVLTKLQKTDTEAIIRSYLDKIYEVYTSEKKQNSIKESDSSKWANIGQYEQYLFHLSSIKQLKIPTTFTMLEAAEVMMDDHFCRILMEQIMKVDPGWVSPKDFPELPVVGPSTSGRKTKSIMSRKIKIKNENNDSERNEETDDMDEYDEEIYIEIVNSSDEDFSKLKKYWVWDKRENQDINKKAYYSYWLWPPCESLIYGLAFKAAEISNMNQNRCKQSAVFEGSLEGGIDTKATIRSMIRNEKKIYISRLASGNEQSIVDGTYPDPFVFIFPNTKKTKEGNWNAYTAGRGLDSFVKNKELFKKIVQAKGHTFISSILVEEYVSAPNHLKSLFNYMSKTNGTLMFGNPCINAKQSAIWLESSNYKCCPILFNSQIYSILAYYKENFNIDIDLDNWKEALLRMAIPFAKKSVTIIADDSLELTQLVREEAARKQISLNVVSHDNFSAAQLEEARHRFTIPTFDDAGLQFIPEAEVLLGQTKETYFEMLPYAIRKQVGYDEN